VPRLENLADLLTHHLGGPEFKKAYVATGCRKASTLPYYHITEMKPINSFEQLTLWRDQDEEQAFCDVTGSTEVAAGAHIDAHLEVTEQQPVVRRV